MNYVGNPPAPGGLILVGDTNPIGAIVWGHKVPDGSYLQLNGQAVSKTTYPALWTYASAFVTTDQTANPGLYLSVDANTFRVPKLDGLFVRGTGQFDANRVAAAIGVRQDDGVGPHVHVQRGGFFSASGSSFPRDGSNSAETATSTSTATNTSSTTDTRPVNVALVPSVKALNTVVMASSVFPEQALSPGTLVGFGMANNTTDAVNDIDISIGKCRATGDTENIHLTTALTKQLDAVWAPGTNAGMRASGAAIADTTYHVFAIKGVSGVDVAADTDVNGANILANTGSTFTNKRRIGSILRVGGTILGFVHGGDDFFLKTPVINYNAAGVVAGALVAMSVPLGLRLRAYVNATAAGGAPGASVSYCSDPLAVDLGPATSGIPGATICWAGAASSTVAGCFTVFTNTSAQIRHREVNTEGLRLFTLGWFDRRGRDDL